MKHLTPFALLALLPATLPGAALAQAAGWSCTFATECLEDACSTSGYEASLTATPTSIDAGIATLTGTLEDPAESFPLAGMDQNGLIRLFNIENATGARLITIAPDGTARYTIHIADPAMAMTYLGRCKEAK